MGFQLQILILLIKYVRFIVVCNAEGRVDENLIVCFICALEKHLTTAKTFHHNTYCTKIETDLENCAVISMGSNAPFFQHFASK